MIFYFEIVSFRLAPGNRVNESTVAEVLGVNDPYREML